MQVLGGELVYATGWEFKTCGHAMIGKGTSTPLKTGLFQAYLLKTLTHFAITATPI